MSCRGSPASSRAPQFHRALRRDNGQVVQPFMRVGTYPTRDFATLGILLLPRWPYQGCGVGRSFLPASACRHADRTISSRTFRLRVRRMVSEDSKGFYLDYWPLVFPADYPHRTRCHQPLMMSGRVAPDPRTSQHIARFYNGLKHDICVLFSELNESAMIG